MLITNSHIPLSVRKNGTSLVNATEDAIADGGCQGCTAVKSLVICSSIFPFK